MSLREYQLMPKAALKAAAALNDEAARVELMEMKDNVAATIMVVVVSVAVVVLGVGIAGYAFTSCDAQAQVSGRAHEIEVKSKVELDLKRQQDAAALRLKYVQSCKVNPDQAELLVPGP